MGFLDDLLGKTSAKASNAAAADTYNKQQTAIGGLNSFADTLPGAYKAAGAGFQPYANAGGGALQQLLAGLGLGGDSEAFTNAYHSLPGYESGLATGTKTAIGGLNASGRLNSGGALKALQRYGSDYENQRAGDYLSRLMGVAGMGQSATGAQAGLEAQGLGAQTGLKGNAFGADFNSAGTVGQGMVAGAGAQQSALTNLLGAGAFLGGSFLGGPTAGAGMSSLAKLFAPKAGGQSTAIMS